MSASEITEHLFLHFSNYDWLLSNSYIFDWESDFFCVSRSGYSYEIEVKVSRGDFFCDFKKEEKHMILKSDKEFIAMRRGTFEFLERPKSNVNIIQQTKSAPNKFFFCTPEGLIKPEEIPSYAGLMEIKPSGKIKTTVPAPFIHKHKQNYKDLLFEKFYWAYRSARLKVVKHKKELQYIKTKIDRL